MTHKEMLIEHLNRAENLMHKDNISGGRMNIDELILRDTPMKPVYKEKTSIVHVSYNNGKSGFEANRYTDYFCPVCDHVVGERYNHPHFKHGYHVQRESKFCNECGQRIDWSDKYPGEKEH